MTAVRPEHLYDRHAGTDDLPADGITRASGMAPRPPGKVPAPQENHGGQMTTMIRRITRQLSVPTTLLATTCAAANGHRPVHLPGPVADPAQVPPRLLGLLAASSHRRCGPAPVRLLLVAAPAAPRPPAGPLAAARAARQAGRPAIRPHHAPGGPQPIRVRPRGRDATVHPAADLLRVAHRRADHRGPGPELDGQRMGRPIVLRCHGLPLPRGLGKATAAGRAASC